MAPRKTNLTLERFNPSSTIGTLKVLNISSTFINLVLLALAIWATYEAFQANYFTNQNVGSKTFSIAILVNAFFAMITLFGLSAYLVRNGSSLIQMAGVFLIPILTVFFHIVYLLNVWKVNGVIVEKESNSALNFIKIWTIAVLIGSVFNLTLNYNRKKRIDKL